VKSPIALEVCAGGGGQALGLEQAGFAHAGLIEIDQTSCETLRLNRPLWNVVQADLNQLDGRPYQGIDLLAGGVPCPPFSVAGTQLGADDERDLFPAMLRLTREIRPPMVMIENVRGLLGAQFASYRSAIITELGYMGYWAEWRLLSANNYGVPQLRPRALLVAIRHSSSELFSWPTPDPSHTSTVGETLRDLMAANGWPGADNWSANAKTIAPTIVGGSHKHGGPDLGPVRARAGWAKLGVNGIGIADDAPAPDFQGIPKLTTRMVARIQGFPDDWEFSGRKTRAYRQIGNAFPPPVAKAMGTALLESVGASQLVLMEK
jgi:DNA (cytosine-5)-methyltransferase 1